MKKSEKVILGIAIFIFVITALTGGGYVAYCYHDGMLQNPLHRAAANGDMDVAKTLLFLGVDVNSVNYFDSTPLEVAVRNGQYDMADFLIDNSANADRKDYQGENVIFPAVYHYDTDMIQLLSNSGVDINAVNQYGNTPLDEAIEMNDNSAIVQVLQKNGAKTEFELWQERQFAAMSDAEKLFTSIANEDFMKCIELLADNPELINAKSNSGENPLHWAAMTGNKEITNLLLSQGVNVNAHDNWGLTPLHKAVIWGNLEEAKLLLSEGATINPKDSKGWTPREWLRHIASGNAYPEIAMLLEKHGGK